MDKILHTYTTKPAAFDAEDGAVLVSVGANPEAEGLAWAKRLWGRCGPEAGAASLGAIGVTGGAGGLTGDPGSIPKATGDAGMAVCGGTQPRADPVTGRQSPVCPQAALPGAFALGEIGRGVVGFAGLGSVLQPAPALWLSSGS